MQTRGGPGTWAPWVVPGLPVLALLILGLTAGLSGDVQYALGGLRATEGSESFLTTFIHRPLAYRAALAALDAPARLAGLGPERLSAYEGALRLAVAAVSAGVGWWLWRTLRTRLLRFEAAAVALAVGATLALPPTWDVLQPDWMGGLFVALGVAAALGLRRLALAGSLGGLFLVLAVGVKVATITLAPLALLLVAAVDARRAWGLVAGTMVWAVVWLVAVAVLLPVEWQWVRDMAALNPNSPLRSPLDARDGQLLLNALAAKVVLQPWLVLLPAAVVLLARTAGSVREAAAMSGLVLAASGLAILPIVIQGQYYLYHLAVLGPLAAAFVALGSARWWHASGRPPLALVLTLPLLGIGGAVVLSQPPAWREAWDKPLLLGLTGIALGLTAWAATVQGKNAAPAIPRRAGPWVAAGALLAASLALLPAMAPAGAWSLDPAATTWTNDGWSGRSHAKQAAYTELRTILGEDVPVLYLAYGDVPYHLGNPTDCPYPSPLWVQRGTELGYVTQFASYRDNVACLASPIPAYAVIQPHWFSVDVLAPTLREVLLATYDCDRRIAVDDLVACPRR